MKNRLGLEVSPYLLQHKDNPVHWHSWNEEAFERAKNEDKPIFLSIGYATCYWCHVMEKDSFENSEVAEILNDSFVCIKVDREERPDVDQIYMDVVVGLTGHGGWPMSVFLTADKKPFFGGTFFPRAQFIRLLEELSKAWREQRVAVEKSAHSIFESISLALASEEGATISPDAPFMAAENLVSKFDSTFGGFGGAPKFPPTQQIRLLFLASQKDQNFLHPALFTLNSMAKGAICDHLEGGFHRYATDAQWEIPHFEKMLYDNALLIYPYTDAFLITKDAQYRDIACRTVEYMINRMQDKSGLFYSAEDAGDVGKEGEFYVWSFEDIRKALSPDEFEALRKATTISETGNFEGVNTLVLKDVTARVKNPIVNDSFEKLLHERNKRARPLCDDKVLTSWNGLAIGALSYAGRAFSRSDFIQAAKKSADSLKQTLYKEKLLHRYREGVSSISGLLEDYAYLIFGLLELYQGTFDEAYLIWAYSLQKEQIDLLWDDNQNLFLSSSNGDIPLKKAEIIDGATPSPNAVSIRNLKILTELFGDLLFTSLAVRIESVLSQSIQRYPAAFSTAIFSVTINPKLIVVTNPTNLASDNISDYISTHYAPELFFVKGFPHSSKIPTVFQRGSLNSSELYFVCQDHACSLPAKTLEEALS